MRIAALLIFSFAMLLTSCKKENLALELRQKTERLLHGKWTVDKKLQQQYEPISDLKHSEELSGGPLDFYDFKPSNSVVISDGAGQQESHFEVINPTQLLIGKDTWFIEGLTSNKVTLYRDRNDVDHNKRYVTRILLKR